MDPTVAMQSVLVVTGLGVLAYLIIEGFRGRG
jgi:hypothetical protein